MDKLFALAGQTIVVTGGLGQLGQTFVTALLERGAKVAILDHMAQQEQQEENLLVVKADITQADEVKRAYTRVQAVLGAATGLINNAGIDSPPHASTAQNGPFESVASSFFDQVLRVNVTGAAICCQVIGGAMARARGGSIVNIGSIYGYVSPDQRLYEFRRKGGEDYYKPAAYGASKAALDNLTKYLATYWAEHKVRVNTLCLGGIKAAQPSAFIRQYNARVPMRRMALAAEAVGPAIFLLSAASSYMTGSRLTVDGGFTSL